MKTTRRWLVLVLVALIAATLSYGVLLSQPNLGGERWRDAQEDTVREAVFRWQIAQHRTYRQACFLTLRGRSPSATAAFVRGHFKDCPFVKPLADSQARATPPAMLSHTKTINGFVDARTGQPALHFWIDAVEWASDAKADVEGGGAAASMSGNEGDFSVAWNGHRWNVTGYKMRAMF